MIEPFIIISNNPLSKEKLEDKYKFEYVDGNVMEVFSRTRDYIHLGHRLLTHPLVSSIKPNEIPFRTILISKNKETGIDMQSLTIMEESINATEKFLKDFSIPNWNERILNDFKVIDYDLIYNVLR